MKKIIGRIVGFPFLCLGTVAFLLGYLLLILGYTPVYGWTTSKRMVHRHLLNLED